LAKFCANCGTQGKLDSSNFCSNCGNSLGLGAALSTEGDIAIRFPQESEAMRMTKTKLDVIVGIICFVHENDWSREEDFDLRPDLKAFGRHSELFGFQLHLCAALRAELATPTKSGEHFLGIWWEGLLEAVLMTDRGFSEQD